MYISTTDRPTDDRPLISKIFRMAISQRRVIRSTSSLVLGGFSGTSDLMAQYSVRTNPRWRPPRSWKMTAAAILEKFQMAIFPQPVVWSIHLWFYCGVFWDGRSNGAISGSNKSKMAAVAILDNFHWSYLRNGEREDLTTLCPRKMHVTTSVTFYIITLTISVRLQAFWHSQ